MKIIFEKLEGNRILDAWTHIFQSTEELLEYMNTQKENLISDEYWLRIRSVKQWKKYV